MHNEKERPTEYFPDGTPIDDWFYDIGMPELEELGRPYVLTEYGIWAVSYTHLTLPTT